MPLKLVDTVFSIKNVDKFIGYYNGLYFYDFTNKMA